MVYLMLPGYQHCTVADCRGQEGVIRLYNGSSVSDGEVEYCFNSTWTPVCGDDWDVSEAAVACRQLGFVGEGMRFKNIEYICCYMLILNRYDCMQRRTICIKRSTCNEEGPSVIRCHIYTESHPFP